MSKQDDPTTDTTAINGSADDDTGNTATRADEDGDVAEPDAPTRIEENVGMSTILGGGGGTGVQTDESDE